MSRRLVILFALALTACGSSPEAAPTSTEPPPTPPTEPAEPLVDEEPAEDADDEGTEPVAVPIAPHEVVVIAVHDDPLLRSEQRLLDVVAERMRLRRLDAVQREATEEEAAFARAFFAGSEGRPTARPSTLEGVTVALFLRFGPNRQLDRDQRATRGVGGVLAFRAGESAPYFEVRNDDVSSWRLSDDQLWPWLVSLVRAEVRS